MKVLLVLLYIKPFLLEFNPIVTHATNVRNITRKGVNDPMEGVFAYSHSLKDNSTITTQRIKRISEIKNNYKICSLSETYDSHLLWAHYAGGFDGVAIEVDLPDNDSNIRKVEHRGVFAFIDMDKFTTEDETARSILFSKYEEWSYEKEIRILSESPWFQLAKPVKRVIAGFRMSQALFDVLNITCTNLGIELNRVGIGDTGIDADYVAPFKFFNRENK